MLLNADFRQNFTWEDVNLEKQNKLKKLSPKNWKRETKVYVNPGLS